MKDDVGESEENVPKSNKRVSLKKLERLFDSKKELYFRLTVLGKFVYMTLNHLYRPSLPA